MLMGDVVTEKRGRDLERLKAAETYYGSNFAGALALAAFWRGG
jgi:hypothetical protein